MSRAAKTSADHLSELREKIHSSYGYWGADDLRDAVGEALRMPAPRGRPWLIREVATHLNDAAIGADEILNAVGTARRQAMPDVWLGVAAVSAYDALAAEALGCSEIAIHLDHDSQTLAWLADEIEAAQRLDDSGRTPLLEAARLLQDTTGWFDYDGDAVRRAHHIAMSGIDMLAAAANQAKEAGATAARNLHQSASAAHAGKLHSNGLDAVDKVVMVTAANPGGRPDANVILTANQADRAATRLDGLSPDDRASFDQMLRDARSPQERAYLLSALAAGHSVRDVATFDQLIHAHGNDPRWLREHLTPFDDDGARFDDFEYTAASGSGVWTQGSNPTCAAASIVTARAKVDPLYTLFLTTGGHPDDPAYDNQDAFAARLHDAQYGVYDRGRSGDRSGAGMLDSQALPLVNSEIGSHDGVTYHTVNLTNTDERRAALSAIEQTVDDGKPVPISVDDKSGAHAMMIVGHDGGLLEIYNPWGYTTWVTESEFVDGHLDQMPGAPPGVAYSVALPG